MAGTHMWDCPNRTKAAFTSSLGYAPELYRIEARCADCHMLMGSLSDEDRARDPQALEAWAEAAGFRLDVVQSLLDAAKPTEETI